MPHELKVLGSDVFARCNSITSVVIPNSLTKIGSSVFANCENLSDVQFEEGLKYIGEYMFTGCNSLTKVVIPNTVEGIDNYAFQSCEKLENLIIEDGDTELKIGGFQPWCYTNVTNLYLGRNIGVLPGFYMPSFWVMTTPVQYTIGEKVTDLSWLQCQKLETIVLKGATPPSCNSFSEGQYAKINVYIPEGTKDAYMQAEPWKNFWNLTEGTPSAIDHVAIDNDKMESIYSSNGCKVGKMMPGINIVKMKSGKVYKIRK